MFACFRTGRINKNCQCKRFEHLLCSELPADGLVRIISFMMHIKPICGFSHPFLKTHTETEMPVIRAAVRRPRPE